MISRIEHGLLVSEPDVISVSYSVLTPPLHTPGVSSNKMVDSLALQAPVIGALYIVGNNIVYATRGNLLRSQTAIEERVRS